jgi:hypothetical protein
VKKCKYYLDMTPLFLYIFIRLIRGAAKKPVWAAIKMQKHRAEQKIFSSCIITGILHGRYAPRNHAGRK